MKLNGPKNRGSYPDGLSPARSGLCISCAYVLRPRPHAAGVADIKLQEAVRHSLCWMLNPRSHAETIASFRQEMEDAVFAVGELEAAVHAACVRK